MRHAVCHPNLELRDQRWDVGGEGHFAEMGSVDIINTKTERSNPMDIHMHHIERLDSQCLGLILIHAGSWRAADSSCWGTHVSALNVSRQWRDSLLLCPDHMVTVLINKHGPEEALVRAARCERADRLALTRVALRTARADCRDSEALILAAQKGHEDVVRLLLAWKEHAPRANCRDGMALIRAAEGGHVSMVKLLLEWREHAPRADCQDGEALILAAQEGNEGMVLLLLEWSEHAPRADCQDGEALISAAQEGNEDVVCLLLEWREHAPRADCQDGEAMLTAAQRGHADVVGIIMEWRENAPRDD